MVRDHVAQRAGLVVVAAAQFDAKRFGDGDLHVIDVAAIPHRLEDAVAEPEDHDVLHGLFAEVMVDAVDLVLAHDRGQAAIQLARRLVVGAERLLHNDPPPAHSLFFRQQAARRQPFAHVQELFGGNRQVEQAVLRPDGVAALRDRLCEAVPRGIVFEVGLDVRELPHHAVERLVVEAVGFLRGDELAPLPGQFLGGPGTADTEHREPIGNQPLFGEVIQRRQQQAARQVAARAEDHDSARVGWLQASCHKFSPPK